jgi:hypothetical protein
MSFICNTWSFWLCYTKIVCVLWRLWNHAELSKAVMWWENLHQENWQLVALHYIFDTSKWWAQIPLSCLLPQGQKTNASEWITLDRVELKQTNIYNIFGDHIVHHASLFKIYAVYPANLPLAIYTLTMDLLGVSFVANSAINQSQEDFRGQKSNVMQV